MSRVLSLHEDEKTRCSQTLASVTGVGAGRRKVIDLKWML